MPTMPKQEDAEEGDPKTPQQDAPKATQQDAPKDAPKVSLRDAGVNPEDAEEGDGEAVIAEDLQGEPSGLGRSDQPAPGDDITEGPGGDVTLRPFLPLPK